MRFTGGLTDVGTPSGWLPPNASLAVEDPALAPALREALDMVAA